MKTYSVTAIKEITVQIEAEDRESAFEEFMDEHLDFNVKNIDGKNLVGYCSYSEKPIFEGDAYDGDLDDNLWLKSEVIEKEEGK